MSKEEIKENDYLYVIDDKVFKDFDKATKHSDKKPNSKLFRTKVIDEIGKYERSVTIKEQVPKGGMEFTDEEFKYIQEKTKDINYCRNWVILNKVDYHSRNYIYVYKKTPTYSVAVLELFKYKNCYALEGGNIKFKTINDFIDYINVKNESYVHNWI